jgi:hypothetical protein
MVRGGVGGTIGAAAATDREIVAVVDCVGELESVTDRTKE